MAYISPLGLFTRRSCIESLLLQRSLTATKMSFMKNNTRNLISKHCSVVKRLSRTYLVNHSSMLLMRAKLLPVATCLVQNGFHYRTYVTSRPEPDSAVAKEVAANKAVVPKLSELSRLVSLAKPESTRLAVAVALLAISSGVTVSVPFALGKVIDTIYSGSSGLDVDMMYNLTRLCAALSGVFLVGAAANFGRVYLMYTSGERIVKRLRESIFNSVMSQEIAFFDKTRTGELVNRLSTDTTVIGDSVTSNISDGFRAVAQAIGGVGMMFYTSAKLAAVVLSIVPPVAIVAVIYGRFLRTISKQIQDALAKSTEVAEEKISSIRTVRAFAQENRERRAYSDSVQYVLDLSIKESLLWGVFYAAMGLSSNLIMLTVLYNGGAMMNEAQITVGGLSSFLLYAAYVGISVGGISKFYTEIMKGLGASTRLWEILDKKPTIPMIGGITPLNTTIQGQIDFRDIHFAYPMRLNVPIFNRLSLSVPAGSVTAVVGSSGSGKSSLGSLLLRYYDADQGQILLDGTDITKLSPDWLRNQIGTVSQEPILFSTTIGENIAYGASDPSMVTPAELVEAASTANALSFIQAFPDKFDTMVGERGLMLSGGQKQRIALARAVLKNPKILMLDEATSALDAESEYLVQEALERLMVGRTVITIAHRLSTIQRANNIAVLDKGSIVEQGTYEQLMKLDSGVFRKLVERQTVMQ